MQGLIGIQARPGNVAEQNQRGRDMSNETNCPVCAAELHHCAMAGGDTWSRVYCPRCKSHLTYEPFRWSRALIGAALYGGALALWMGALASAMGVASINSALIAVAVLPAPLCMYVIRWLGNERRVVLVPPDEEQDGLHSGAFYASCGGGITIDALLFDATAEQFRQMQSR